MVRIIALLMAVGGTAGCAYMTAHSSENCYVESAWLDSSNGCSVRAGYPDCYLVCPHAGSRVRVEDAPYLAQSTPTNPGK